MQTNLGFKSPLSLLLGLHPYSLILVAALPALLDFVSTQVSLSLGNIETSLYGNTVFGYGFELAFCLISTVLLYMVIKRLRLPKIARLICLVPSMFWFYPFINNLAVIYLSWMH
jgi:hypothetical protein